MSIYLSSDPHEALTAVVEALGGEPTLTITISGPDANKAAAAMICKNSLAKNLLGTPKAEGSRVLVNVEPTITEPS